MTRICSTIRVLRTVSVRRLDELTNAPATCTLSGELRSILAGSNVTIEDRP